MRLEQSAESGSPEKRQDRVEFRSRNGSTSEEARRLLAILGMPGTPMHPLRRALEKFWVPFHGCSRPRSSSRLRLAIMPR
jgi:hypothetical protein